MRARLFLPLSACILVAAPAYGGEFETALEAARRGDFAEAYCTWKPLAHAGHAAAQYHLGWMYSNGEGLAVNDVEAVRWRRGLPDRHPLTGVSAPGP